jgi:hypothetical protein
MVIDHRASSPSRLSLRPETTWLHLSGPRAALRQATVRLLYAIPPPQTYYPYSMVELEQIETGKEKARNAAQEVLETALAKAGGEPAGTPVKLESAFGARPPGGGAGGPPPRWPPPPPTAPSPPEPAVLGRRCVR